MLLCVFVKTFVGFAQNTLHWKFIDDKSRHITITVQYLWYNELFLITTFIYQKKVLIRKLRGSRRLFWKQKEIYQLLTVIVALKSTN